VIASNLGQARHGRPGPGRRIPKLTLVCWVSWLSVRVLSPPASAGHKNFAVGEYSSVKKFASSGHHRSSVRPDGSRSVQVDDLCGVRWERAIASVKPTGASTHHQHFAVIIHHCRSPITSPVIAIPDGTPRASASNIKIPCHLTGPSAEHVAVRGNKHEWIKSGQCQVRSGQVAPGCRCCLPHLRFDIDIIARIDRATDYEHVSIRQRGIRWVPSALVHVRQPRPGVIPGVIHVSVGQADIVGHISTRYKELPIGQKGMA
jgi:hypothetical protein